MNNKTALVLATVTVILNGLIGHFFAPFGIMLTPIVLVITTSLVCFGTKNIEIIYVSVLSYLFIAINDILIKLYSGGSHDHQGLGWIHLMFFVGLVPSFGILLITIFRSKKETVENKIMALILFIGLISAHLFLFSSLGLGRRYWYEWNG